MWSPSFECKISLINMFRNDNLPHLRAWWWKSPSFELSKLNMSLIQTWWCPDAGKFVDNLHKFWVKNYAFLKRFYSSITGGSTRWPPSIRMQIFYPPTYNIIQSIGTPTPKRNQTTLYPPSNIILIIFHSTHPT